MNERAKRWSVVVVVVLLGLAAWQAACSSSSDLPPGPTTNDGGNNEETTLIGDGGASALAISPQNPAVDVTINNGVITTAPLTFTASSNGAPVSPSWSLDRGELGAIGAANGVFTASGNVSGDGVITATLGSAHASTTITVRIHAIQNGGDACPDGGAGGCGGVGGEGLGGPVDPPTIALLRGPANAPANAAELGFLYPYDQTVWPRGLLAPLLQWQTTHSASAVYVHLTQKNYEFEGFYSGKSLVHQPIDATGWKQATYGNGGDPLHAELKIADSGKAYGPIAQDWKVAPGTLKGTIYYTEYSNANPRFGADTAIKPGSGSPTYATVDMSCHACHEVSADGSTMISTVGGSTDQTSYDLTKNGKALTTYTGNASDNTPNAWKFTFSALYPDAKFAMTSSRWTLGLVAGINDDSYAADSQLFRTSDATAIPTTGWSTSVTTSVTPAFSPDGKRLAFNYWEGTTTNGVAPGNGHNLAVMDFACNAADGGAACGSPPYAFSNLRELYKDSKNYPAWPAFLPSGNGVVFHMSFDGNLCTGTGCGVNSTPQAELWWVDVPPNAQTATKPTRLDALMGLKNNQSYLPTNGLHPSDARLAYKPTVVPISVGGYSWVVFMSRRLYGNVLTGDPFARADNTAPCLAKLWVAAIDLNPTPGKDPSHPAFYLPGQNMMHANIHGFWATDPCHPNGAACTSGDECCGGYCRTVDGGSVCSDQPTGCAQEFEKCTSDSDCCGAQQGFSCVNSHCARPPPN